MMVPIYLEAIHKSKITVIRHYEKIGLVAILVGSRDHRTQVWKGTIQGPFHQWLDTSSNILLFVVFI